MTESWNTFASNTTLHGLRYVFGQSSWFRRIFWTMCMLVGIFLFTYFLRINIVKYRSLPVDTRTSYKFYENGIPFPAVTICNLNQFDKTKIDLGYEDRSFKAYHLDIPACDVARNISGNITCGHALLCATHGYASWFNENCTKEIQKALKEALKRTGFDVEEFKSRFGSDFESTLVGPCSFSLADKCSAKEFTPIMSNIGLCHTFNNHPNGTQKNLRFSGEGAGLRLTMDTKGLKSVLGGRSVGFRVIIHDQSPIIHVYQGFDVQPGTSVVALIKATKYFRLSEPYESDCSSRHLGDFGNYTRETCVWKCINDDITRDCGCRLMGSPVSKKVPVCSFEAERCSRSTLGKWNIENCSCPLPCEETRYYTTTSYSKYPSETFLRVLKNRYKLNQSETHLKSNLVHVRIGFADNTHQVYTEYPSYPDESLYADIGGSMGLLLGCSILTVVEFIDYLFRKICTSLMSKKQTRTSREHTEENKTA